MLFNPILKFLHYLMTKNVLPKCGGSVMNIFIEFKFLNKENSSLSFWQFLGIPN